MRRLFLISVITLLVTGCEDTIYRSSVPYYPVGFSINTNTGIFVHFKPTNVGSYLILNKDGFKLSNGLTMPRTASDAYGYAGVIVYIDNYEQYSAFDLCCPHCLLSNQPDTIDGFFAVCPVCGEKYDLSWGYALPTQGISKEPLRKYKTIYSNDRLTVTN